MEVQPGTGTEFWVSYRRDVDSITRQAIDRTLSEKFEVVSFLGRNFATGHPEGCNALWESTMMEAWHRSREGFTQAQAILTFEADCVPLRSDWILALESEWIRLQPAEIVGHVHTIGHEHINGNAMFRSTLLRDHPTITNHPAQAFWDFTNRFRFLKIGKDTPLIFQLYNWKTISEEDFIRVNKDGVRPALLHGIKDDSARKWARKHIPVEVAQ